MGGRIEAARVEAPLFILGHYRSGTTHLHNLLALDPQFAAPTVFQVLNPHTFLGTERWAAPVVTASSSGGATRTRWRWVPACRAKTSSRRVR